MDDVVPVIINRDYGADHSALCELARDVQKCLDVGVILKFFPLDPPVEVSLALEAEETEGIALVFKAAREFLIHTTVDTLSGPFLLRNIEYLVFSENMPHVLLSRPMLRSIGFDLTKHMADVRH